MIILAISAVNRIHPLNYPSRALHSVVQIFEPFQTLSSPTSFPFKLLFESSASERIFSDRAIKYHLPTRALPAKLLVLVLSVSRDRLQY
jgi:hypothetical protein